ncbi:MAG: UPF0175 family protein [Nitrospinae bacterium]|nr:UPF0175 family protein [Nitrospinota bacterium]
METKSRYEVIAELEGKKRDLIKERDSLNDVAKAKANELRDLERKKEDTIVVLGRQIDDAKEEAERFNDTLKERKITIRKAATLAEISYVEILDLMSKESIDSGYTLSDLKEDLNN